MKTKELQLPEKSNQPLSTYKKNMDTEVLTVNAKLLKKGAIEKAIY